MVTSLKSKKASQKWRKRLQIVWIVIQKKGVKIMTQNEEYIKMIGDALLKQTENERKPYDPKEHERLMAKLRMARMMGIQIDLGR